MYNFPYIQALVRNYEGAEIDSRISPNDRMNNQHYFDAGRSAVENIVVALMASNIKKVEKVLDVPCGHGRVLRHLIHLLPGVEFHACDVDVDAVDFCAKTFGAKPIYSRAELSEVDFGSQYELIWVGSLFTHTAQDVTRRWMSHLARFLSPTGVVVATVHGRWAEHVQEVNPYIEKVQWWKILKNYHAAGYGYNDYLLPARSHVSGTYGVSLAKPHATIRNVEDIPGVRIFLYLERGWVDHQDVLVFGRPSYDIQWIIGKSEQEEEMKAPE